MIVSVSARFKDLVAALPCNDIEIRPKKMPAKIVPPPAIAATTPPWRHVPPPRTLNPKAPPKMTAVKATAVAAHVVPPPRITNPKVGAKSKPPRKLPLITKSAALAVARARSDKNSADDDDHLSATMWQEAQFVNYWADYEGAADSASSGSKDLIADDEELTEFYKNYKVPLSTWEKYDEHEKEKHLEEEVEPVDLTEEQEEEEEVEPEEFETPAAADDELPAADDEELAEFYTDFDFEHPAVADDEAMAIDEATPIIHEAMPPDHVVESMLSRLRAKWMAEKEDTSELDGQDGTRADDAKIAKRHSRVRGGRVVQAARLRGLMDEMLNEQMMEAATAKATKKAARKRKWGHA
jgi:hypothetical protein